MPRNPQGIYSLPAGNPVVSGTLIESTWANPTMSDIAAALTGSVPRDGTAGMQAQLLLVDQTANPPNNGQMAISVDYLTNVLENYQSGAQGGAGNPIIFENDRIATVDYTIQNGKNGMTAGPFAINAGVTIGVPSGSQWTIVGGGTTSGPTIALSDTFPLMNGSTTPGVGTFASRNDHVHPSDTSRAQVEAYLAIVASDINCALAQVFSKTVSSVVTFTFSNPAVAGKVSRITLELTNGGAFIPVWPTSVKWASGAPPSFTVSGTDILEFYTRDGGITWRGSVLSKDNR